MGWPLAPWSDACDEASGRPPACVAPSPDAVAAFTPGCCSTCNVGPKETTRSPLATPAFQRGWTHHYHPVKLGKTR